MHPIHIVRMPDDKSRPAVILTREGVRERMTRITVAPITRTVKGLSIEVPVGAANGLDAESVINCDNITTVLARDIGRRVGYVLPRQEGALAAAVIRAFDLEV